MELAINAQHQRLFPLAQFIWLGVEVPYLVRLFVSTVRSVCPRVDRCSVGGWSWGWLGAGGGGGGGRGGTVWCWWWWLRGGAVAVEATHCC